jgi:hypothetical protein
MVSRNTDLSVAIALGVIAGVVGADWIGHVIVSGDLR